MNADGDSRSGFHLFGRRLAKITCYKESLMSGISGGMVTGIAYFLFTSNVKRATNLAFGSFLGVTVIAWNVCRSLKAPPMGDQELRDAIKTKIRLEGTELEKEMELESQTKDV